MAVQRLNFARRIDGSYWALPFPARSFFEFNRRESAGQNLVVLKAERSQMALHDPHAVWRARIDPSWFFERAKSGGKNETKFPSYVSGIENRVVLKVGDRVVLKVKLRRSFVVGTDTDFAGGPGGTRTCNQTVMSGKGDQENLEDIDE